MTAASAPAGIVCQDAVSASLRAECDVAVIGSGAGGATMAAELADAGLSVIVIEEGGYHPTSSFTADSGSSLRTLYRDGGACLALGRPSLPFAEGCCVGGSTVVNGGMSWRTPPQVLDRWALQDGIISISAQQMEPYFATAESRLSVRGQDPETISRDSLLTRAGAQALGWQVIPALRNQLHCAGSNNCNNGCPTGAKRSMLVTHIPRALARGARLFADCRAGRITFDGRRVTGVTARFVRPGAQRAQRAQRGQRGQRDQRGQRGPRLTVRAGAVVVACGAVQTPALLARSGIRPASSMLGRRLGMHPITTVTAVFDSDVSGWQGAHQAFQVRDPAASGIVLFAANLPPARLAAASRACGAELGELMACYNQAVTVHAMIEDTPAGRVRAVPGLGAQVFYQLTDADAARLAHGAGLAARALLAAGARRVLLPFHGAPQVRSPAELRAVLARPLVKRALEMYSVHLMGTARMSEDPRKGVVDSFGACHGVPGLYVADASVFPSPVGINPMETVVALALRNARHFLERRGEQGR